MNIKNNAWNFHAFSFVFIAGFSPLEVCRSIHRVKESMDSFIEEHHGVGWMEELAGMRFGLQTSNGVL